jgi:hypothetical protein
MTFYISHHEPGVRLGVDRCPGVDERGHGLTMSIIHDNSCCAEWETAENGMRRPGELVEEFAERAGSEAWLADARQGDAGKPVGPAIQPTGASAAPDGPEDSQNELAARLLNDASTPEGRAYGRAFSDTAATYVRELRERDPLPEPDRMPGAPHPDPFLAGRGWQVNEHGIYTRRAHPEPQAPPERDLEAGL